MKVGRGPALALANRLLYRFGMEIVVDDRDCISKNGPSGQGYCNCTMGGGIYWAGAELVGHGTNS